MIVNGISFSEIDAIRIVQHCEQGWEFHSMLQARTRWSEAALVAEKASAGRPTLLVETTLSFRAHRPHPSKHGETEVLRSPAKLAPSANRPEQDIGADDIVLMNHGPVDRSVDVTLRRQSMTASGLKLAKNVATAERSPDIVRLK